MNPNNMRLLKLSSLMVAVCLVNVSSVVHSQEKNDANPLGLTSNQLLMRDKLSQMNRVLEGITLNRFDQVEASAKTLGMISKATSWHIVEQTPQYRKLLKNFQEQASDLERHAQQGNGEAMTLDLVRMNITCTACHQHMREGAVRGK